MSTPQKPLLLAELGIPGRSKDPVSKDPDVWGINIAAALDNFPYHGLRCEAGPWGNMASGDRLTIFWGTGHNVLSQTVLKDEVDTQLRMFVPSRHMDDGEFAVSYSVKPLGGTDQPSEIMQVLVKLTRPGGHDNNGDDGHSRLIMIIPQEILDGGIHKNNVAAGVDISIGKADGTPPYPFAAAGDICRVSWGGIFVLSAPLTQDQAEGTAPIIVKIKEDIIREAGDAGGPGIPGVAVVFEVYDKVFNRSEGWSPEQRVVVAVHATRLGAPLLKEALNNVLDVDQLGDADGTVQVVATDNAHFKIGDIPFIKIKGTPVEGPPIDLEIEGLPLISVPSVVETKAPNAVLRQLAKSQITVSYRLKKADGSADLISNGQFIRAIVEVQRLAEPIMLDEDSGALNPPLDVVLMDIPFDTSFVEGYVLQPIMLGTTAGLKPYLPALPTRPITHNDIVAAKPLSYSIDSNHLTPVNGGTAEFYYQLLIPSAAFAKLDAYQASHAIRESIHTDILRVGKPRRELPEPVVAGVVDGVLPADTPGTTATVIYTETVKGDEVFMFWVGSITGEYPDSIKLNEFTAGKEVPFPIPAEMIKGNEGGTVVARYEIKRADGRTSYAEPLKFDVGVALDLKEPKIKQAPNDTSLDPLEAQNALTSVINYDGMLVGDRIIVRLTGAPGTPAAGSHTTEPWPVTTVGPQEIPLAVSVLAFNLAKSITLDYTVTRGTQDPKESRIRALAVSPIAQSDLPGPLITQASEQGEGPELDVSQLTTNATLRANSYPHIALRQYVWLKAKGTLKGGGDYSKTFWQPPGSHVSATWINQGFYAHNGFPLPDLQSLEDGSDLELKFKAGFGGSQVETEAVTFALRTYRIKAYENVVPTLGSVTGSPSGNEIPHGGLTVETAVTLSGVAAKGQKVEIFVGTVSKDQATAHATTGVWTLLVSALAVAAHSFTVKALYGSGAVSAARTLTVTPVVVPTLSNVLDDKNVEIPEGQTTVSTALKLIGTASKGQRVEIFEGNGPSHTSKGVATASTATGMWELPITVAVGARRLYAGSLYTSSPQWSNVRTLTVTAATAPTLTSVKGSPSDDEIPQNGTTVETAVTLSGVAAKGQKVEIFDGTVSKDQATAHATTGVWTLLISALAVAAHSFTVKALYGSGAVSAARTLTVTAATAPTLTSVKGSPSDDEIPQNGTTVETAVTLSGVAAKGQKVEIFDGTVSKGPATADPTTGVWTLLISALAVAAHSFTAKALYGTGLPSSAARTIRVVARLTIDVSQMYLSGYSVKTNWPRTGQDSIGNTGSRLPQGGIPAYNFRSSNSIIASVTAQGKVTGNSNGEATIYVTDQMKNEVSFPVIVTNTWRLLINEGQLTNAQTLHWIQSIGGQAITYSEFRSDVNRVYIPPNRTKGYWLGVRHPNAPTHWLYVETGSVIDLPGSIDDRLYGAWCLAPN